MPNLPIIAYLALLLLLPFSCARDYQAALITGDQLILRSSPRKASDNDTGHRLYSGDIVQILQFGSRKDRLEINGQEVEDVWHKIQAPNNAIGFVYAYYLELIEEEHPIAAERYYVPPPPSLYRPRVPPKEDMPWWEDKWEDFEIWWSDSDERKELKQLIIAADYDDPLVRNTAVQIAGQHPGRLNLGQICDLWDYAMERWKYVNDPPNQEYLAKASESISNDRAGDCDDFAVLNLALVTAIGAEARISFVYGDRGGHAFTEVLLYQDDQQITLASDYLRARYQTHQLPGLRVADDGAVWLNLDWFADHPGGDYFPAHHGVTYDIYRKSFSSF